MLKDRCTLLLSSCDKYCDTWDPFFICLRKFWPTFDMNVVLNTETKKYKYKGFKIKTFEICKHSKMAWGKRLIENLKKIDTEYILFMLEDYFIIDIVNQNELEKCIRWMDENKNIAVFSFHRAAFDVTIECKKYTNYELRLKNGNYSFNCQTEIR